MVDLGVLERLSHFIHFRLLVLDLEVDLTAVGVPVQRRHELAEWPVLRGDDADGRGEGNRAAVAVEVVPEIEVPAQFASEDRVPIGHGLFHEGVPDALPPRCSVGGKDFLRHHARAAQIVDDHGARVVLQEVAPQQGRHQVATDGLRLFVDEDTAVGVAVETDAQIRLAALHRGLQLP